MPFKTSNAREAKEIYLHIYTNRSAGKNTECFSISSNIMVKVLLLEFCLQITFVNYNENYKLLASNTLDIFSCNFAQKLQLPRIGPGA